MPSAHSLNGLMKWLAKEPWRTVFEEFLDDHVNSVLDEHGLQSFDELGGLIDAHWAMTLWGCAFEDFLTKEVEGAGNIVDDYLKRRGWKESAGNKSYMYGLKDSVMSLYEISHIEPGRSFLARDLIRGVEPVRVSERTATKTLKPWDRVALRIVDVRNTKVIGGGLLPFEREASDILVAMFGDDADEKHNDMPTLFDRLAADQNDLEFAHLFSDPSNKTELLRNLAPVFSMFFLEDLIERIVNPAVPEMLNSDGEELEFMRLVYPLETGVTEAQVGAVLNQAPDLEAASHTFWNWFEYRRPKKKKKREANASPGLEFVTTTENDSIVLGTIELKSNKLELRVNSEGRAERGRKELEPLLDGLVKAPLAERQTLERALEENGDYDQDSAAFNLPTDERHRITHEAMDNHYRAQLNEPIPALGNISPRRAIQSKKGRNDVVAWLKLLENQTAKHDPDDPMASYDSTWIWAELGLLDLRK